MLTSDQVYEITFSTVRLRSGYDMLEVDGLLNRLANTLGNYEQGVAWNDLTADELAVTTFRQTKLREGYRQDEIDEFVEEASTCCARSRRPSLATRRPTRRPKCGGPPARTPARPTA